MKQYCVYIHKNKINNKIYVGITCQKPIYRWKNGSGYPKSTQPKMYNAINKYGWDNFEHIIVAESLTYEEANKLEQELILKYNSFVNGYNMSLGGDGNRGHIVSEESRQQMKLTHCVPHPGARGRKLSEEHKNKLRESHLGKNTEPRSSETKEKISNALRGKPKSDTAKQNMSKAKIGTKPWNYGLTGLAGHLQSDATKLLIAVKNGKAIMAYDQTNNNVITFISISKAVKYLKENISNCKANRTTLTKCLDTDMIYYGYIWKIIKEIN